MPIIQRPLQEAQTRQVQPADTQIVGRAVSQLGQQIVQVDQKIQDANRSRRVNDATTMMHQSIMDNEAAIAEAPQAFESHEITNKAYLENLKSQLVKSAKDPQELDAVMASFNQAALQSTARVRQDARRLSIYAGRASLDTAEQTLSDNYLTLKSATDREATIQAYNDMMDQAVADGIENKDAAEKRKYDFVSGVEKNRAYREMDTDPAAVLNGLAQGYYAVTEHDNRVLSSAAGAAIKAQQADIRRAKAEQDKQVAISEAWDFANLSIKIRDGGAQPSDISAFVDKYRESKVAARDYLQLDKAFRKEAGSVLSMMRVSEALQGNAYIDPNSKEDKKAADAMFQGLAAKWSPGELPEKAAWFSARLGIVPKSLKGEIEGRLGTMHDPNAVLYATEIVTQMVNQNPGLAGEFHADTLNRATEIQMYTKAGMNPKAALELYNQVRQVAEPVRKARSQEFRAAMKDSEGLTGFLQDSFDDAEVPTQMAAQAESLAASMYAVHGNLEVAKAQALTAAKTRWGPSLMDESKLQIDPPEVFYGVSTKTPDENRAWQQEQLKLNIESVAALRNIADKTDKNYIVTSHPTLRAKNGKPVYSIQGVSKEDGTILQIGTWVPDYETSMQFINDKAERHGLMLKAQRLDNEEVLRREGKQQDQKALLERLRGTPEHIRLIDVIGGGGQ
jgi:hypothetical protein